MSDEHEISRRTFLKGVAATAGVIAAGRGSVQEASARPDAATTHRPPTSPGSSMWSS